MIKLHALGTAVLLTATVILSAPTKAEVSQKSAKINNLPLVTNLLSTNIVHPDDVLLSKTVSHIRRTWIGH